MRASPCRLTFGAATAVLALHTVMNAFLAPERGTGWRDHLLSGGVTLALLAAAAVVFARARPGVQAVPALVLGVLAIEGAVLAVFDARAVGVRGDDWTGFLLAPAGVALLAVGAMTLWRSRRPGRHRYVRRGLLALGAVLSVLLVVVPLAVALGATHRPRATVPPLDLGRPHRDVALRTSDGLKLAAWYVPSRNGAAVVSFPTRRGKPDQARMLVRHGYGVLLVDMRGYDGSDGDPNAFGWGATKDLDAAVAWLRRQPDVRDGRIGGIGFSVGGEQLLDDAAQNPGLRAVVSEGAGERSYREELIYGARGWFALPGRMVLTAAVAFLSGESPPPSLRDVVARISPRAILLVYAGHGVGGEDLNVDFYRAAGERKELWKIPEAHHVGGYAARPREYERRIVGFFDRQLLGRS
jgi:hypothetical protein